MAPAVQSLPPTLPDNAPILRTLAPALRSLERNLASWADQTHRYALTPHRKAALDGLTADLHRQADGLDVDRPLLVVMLMGGTGVGKSTLLNALAGGSIAQASFTRPTTRDPVVYYHETVRPDRLDPALRHCRLVPHERANLAQKILVDTPDVDSNDLTNREKLINLLPVADVVLFVGSQEKYHDQLVWNLFLQQRRRRAFAFVLNKWDRCLHAEGTGVRPDEDLRHDLEAEGFQSPLIFRTCAQFWLEKATAQNQGKLPEGEQFGELLHWLELGLTRAEIDSIKVRGVGQLLATIQGTLEEAAPPDLTSAAQKTQAAWELPLTEEAGATAEILLNTLEPNQKEIEHHFALEGQRRFRGLMAWYLQLITRTRFAGSSLRQRIPFLPRSREPDAPRAWDLAMFTRACSDVAANRELDARGKALVNRLLVVADSQNYPLWLLTEPVESLGALDWRQRYAIALSEVLADVEKTWTRPKGMRRWVQTGLIWVANWLPPLALLAALVNFLWRFFDPKDRGYDVGWKDALLPAVVVLAVLIILHLLINLLMPLRWASIRDEFRKRLEARLRQDLDSVYSRVPGDLADALKEERRQVEKLVAESQGVSHWLEQREKSTQIAGLYGHE
jgi:hypothetical protein